MKKSLLALSIIGLISQGLFSQVVQLSEVHITANYKYLDAVSSKEVAVPVKMLEEKVGYYNLKKSDLYSDEYETYTISFYIPEGKVVAAYDSDGKILRTIEKFKDIDLPSDVISSLEQRFPNWTIKSNVYRVSYFTKSGNVNKVYKIELENGDQTIFTKIDDKGEFL